MNRIKRLIKEWLGINQNETEIKKLNLLYTDLVSIGLDVHFKEPSMILIYSHLKGGQIRHISADFKTLNDLNRFVRDLKDRFRVTYATIDFPAGYEHDRTWFKI